MNQLDIFADTIAATEAAIRQVDEHADLEWRRRAYEAVRWCAYNLYEFTSDSAWQYLAERHPNVTTHEPAAMGPIFRRAAQQGLIRKAGTFRKSVFSQRHRDLVVWRSIV